ncbi:MAG: serine/threonine protein kinase [Desulfobacteraceae bacterium A6]|nr:MAG: serine/threonine protein kinase [Desulfobacteraceae bacterium A6]
MSKPGKTAVNNKAPFPNTFTDEYGNVHHPTDELDRGGQGVVFRTVDVDLAIKQPLDTSGNPDKNAHLHDRFQNIRLLPLPPRIPISLPLAILRDETGYVMRLLNGMKPFNVFDLNGKTKAELRKAVAENKQEVPKWIAAIPDKDMGLLLFHYANTGSTRRRLFAFSKCASILARLHSAGLVYGDISLNNVFVGDGDSREVWLIDADNLRFERSEGGNAVYTQHYGAPEIVQGRDQSRPRTDCWAFAVMAFRTLALCHPFIGKKVLEPDNDEGGWDAEPAADDVPADLHEQAYAGYLPFIDDDDDTNAAVSGLPRELVATQGLRRLFQETFGAGRTQPHRRPAMAFWALELAKAFDQSLTCPDCAMSYFADNQKKCPYCDAPRPAFARAKTPRWEVLIPADVTEFILTHRLFNPFSFEHNDDTEYEAVLDFSKKTAQPVRGTNPFPSDLSFEFVEAEK